MTIHSETFGRACFVHVFDALTADDILIMRKTVDEARLRGGGPPVLVLKISASVAWPIESVQEAFRTTWPRMARMCKAAFVAVEATDANRGRFRSLFLDKPKNNDAAEIFDSMVDAVSRAQREAPDDIIELQRRSWRRQ